MTFTAAAMSTGVETTGPHAVRRSALPDMLAHSVVPIVVGYMTAHYLSYFVEQGQTTLIQLSDPMVRGDNLLGTANLGVNYWLSFHPTLLAVIKVLAISPATSSAWSRARPRDHAAATTPPRHRSARDARGDGLLHGHRALPADGRGLIHPAGEHRVVDLRHTAAQR